jgi:predicted acetyltransferase
MSIVVAQDIEVRAIRSEAELQFAHELMARNHKPAYDDAIDWLTATVRTYPGLLPEHTRIALRGGEITAALRLNVETLRLGEARLKMLGLGWVTTDPERRGQGIAAALIQDSLQYAHRHGFHVSMLFGIPNYYTRFGYSTCLSEHFVTVRVGDIPRPPLRGLSVRSVRPGDLRAIQRMHEEQDREVACSILRNGAHLSSLWDRVREFRVFLTSKGQIAGYVWPKATEDAFEILEVGYADERTRIEVLAWCAEFAINHLHDTVRYHLPPEHPLAWYLRTFPSSHETRFVRDRDGMMCLVDIGEALESCVPEWESRVRDLAVSGVSTELTLYVNGVPYRIRSNRGVIDVSENSTGRNKFVLTAQQLTRLIVGYERWQDIYFEERRLINPDARALLPVLFPKRNPYVHPFDRF